MSAVCILTPMLIGSWPMIATAVMGVAGSLGFSIASKSRDDREEYERINRVETELPNSEIFEERAGESQTIRIERDGVAIEFRRDAHGACSVCVSGDRNKSELRKIGQEVAGRVVQQFAYHRLVTELKKRNFAVVEESVQKDSSIRVRVRRNG